MREGNMDVQDVGAAVRQLRELAGTSRPGQRQRLSIGIINNMPDNALDVTGQQFSRLLQGAAGHVDLRIQMFSLPGILRHGATRARIKAEYFEFERLQNMHMDALIVTGSPPGSGALTSEPFWPHFAALVDWARLHTLSTLWSCLSAHAAVLHLDGIERRRLPNKLSGVYDVETERHAMTTGLGDRIVTPHSRYNALDEAALRKAGYDILARAPAVGADLFCKSMPSLFVFLQGHPEYNADTLAREYRRDLGRYLDGTNDHCPTVPANYFSAAFESECLAFAAQAHQAPSIAAAAMPDMISASPATAPWAANAQQFFRNWIGEILAIKSNRPVLFQKVM